MKELRRRVVEDDRAGRRMVSAGGGRPAPHDGWEL
jgi:hypothetical protein